MEKELELESQIFFIKRLLSGTIPCFFIITLLLF